MKDLNNSYNPIKKIKIKKNERKYPLFIMKKIVIEVVERHGFDWKYDVPNYGCIAVIESTKQQVKRIELELYKGEG